MLTDFAPVHSWWTVAISGWWNLLNACSARKRKALARPPKKTGCPDVCPRGVGGRRGVTWRLCLFRVSPPGSVSNCGHWSEICLCCQREAIYLTALWKKNKSTAGQAVSALPTFAVFIPDCLFSLRQLAFFWHFRLPYPSPRLMRSSFWSPSNRRPTRRVKSRRREDLSVYPQASQSSVKVFFFFFSVSQLIVLVLWPLFSAHFLKWW